MADAMGEHRQREQPEVTRHASGRTRFDDHVDDIKERDGVSHLEAMSRARKERPGLFRDSQGLGQVYKNAPSSYEDMVSNEMITKGVVRQVAEQRLINTYGSALPLPAVATLSKRAESAECRLQHRAYEIADATGLPMEVALRKARQERPYLVQAMNTY